MKLLLTSAGIKNKSIQNALVDLLGKPIAESSALCIPTATYAMGGPGAAWRMITGRASTPLCELGWKSPAGGDSALGMVDFSLFPHLDHADMPDFSMAGAEEWAAGVPVPGYAIDDQTALKVTGGTVEVVSEGHWRLFTP